MPEKIHLKLKRSNNVSYDAVCRMSICVKGGN